MPTSARGPFRPGPGRLPPYLAGREREQSLFRELFSDVQRGLAPSSEILIHGPRGNGKTALLVWLQEKAAPEFDLDLLRLDPTRFSDEESLVRQVLSDSFWRRLKPDGISISGICWRPGQADPPPLHDALAARVRRRPLVLLLDEAHTLDPGVAGILLNASRIVGAELPFLLVLAGTPDLRARLSRASSSFWNRADKLPIGRLADSAVAEAIQRPLAADDIGVTDDALDRIVREAQGYPFFVQLWGRAVWRRVSRAGAGALVTPEVVEAATPEVVTQQRDYYLDRYDELDRLDLLPAARSVADAFADEPQITNDALKDAVRSGLGDAADREEFAAALETLRHLGLVWRAGGGDPGWEPGIPSLMDYLREQVPTLAG